LWQLKLMTDTLFILLSLTSFAVGIGVRVFINKYLKQTSAWTKSILKTFVYAVFFGIGAVGGGGEPGFALPAPILPSALFSDSEQFWSNAFYPFLFWLTVFFCYEMIKLLYLRFVKRQKAFGQELNCH
jgi:hypothetical protein